VGKTIKVLYSSQAVCYTIFLFDNTHAHGLSLSVVLIGVFSHMTIPRQMISMRMRKNILFSVHDFIISLFNNFTVEVIYYYYYKFIHNFFIDYQNVCLPSKYN